MFCSNCGQDWAGVPSYPKHCEQCGKTHYRNPIPVVVCLIPAVDGRDEGAKPGVLLVRRTLAQTAGKWALPGGFIDLADASWRQAASREVWEETGMEVPPERWAPFDLETASDRNLLVFVKATDFVLRWDGCPPPVNQETDALRVVREVEELAFPTHTAALRRFLEGDRRG